MKKYLIPLCLALLLLSGCRFVSSAPSIEEHIWQMTSVQSGQENGQIIAQGTLNEQTAQDVLQLTLLCTVRDGQLILSDETSGRTFSGSCEQTQVSRQSRFYRVILGSQEGLAVCSTTTYHDGSQVPTLIISLGEYALHFLGES